VWTGVTAWVTRLLNFQRTVLPSPARCRQCNENLWILWYAEKHTFNNTASHSVTPESTQGDSHSSVTGLKWTATVQQFIKPKLTASAEESGRYACYIYRTELLVKAEHVWMTALLTISTIDKYCTLHIKIKIKLSTVLRQTFPCPWQ
jgi:hypothetical protein